jgi:hypothetical protein
MVGKMCEKREKKIEEVKVQLVILTYKNSGLWLSATLSRAKALVGLSPKAWLLAWPSFRL